MSPTAAAGLAVFAGVLIAVQATILGAFDRHIHALAGAFWVHVGGLILAALLVGVLGIGFQVEGLRAYPWGPLAGVAGVGIVASVAVAVTGLGLGTALVIVVAVQLVAGFALDAFGVTGVIVPITPLRVLGVVLIVVGALLTYVRTPTT